MITVKWSDRSWRAVLYRNTRCYQYSVSARMPEGPRIILRAHEIMIEILGYPEGRDIRKSDVFVPPSKFIPEYFDKHAEIAIREVTPGKKEPVMQICQYRYDRVDWLMIPIGKRPLDEVAAELRAKWEIEEKEFLSEQKKKRERIKYLTPEKVRKMVKAQLIAEGFGPHYQWFERESKRRYKERIRQSRTRKQVHLPRPEKGKPM